MRPFDEMNVAAACIRRNSEDNAARMPYLLCRGAGHHPARLLYVKNNNSVMSEQNVVLCRDNVLLCHITISQLQALWRLGVAIKASGGCWGCWAWDRIWEKALQGRGMPSRHDLRHWARFTHSLPDWPDLNWYTAMPPGCVRTHARRKPVH